MELKLVKYEINRLHYERIIPKKVTELKASFTARTVKSKDKDKRDCNIEFTLASKDSDVINVGLEITASFDIDGVIDDEQQFEYSAMEKIYPYIREAVANLTHTAEISALFLPVEMIPMKKDNN